MKRDFLPQKDENLETGVLTGDTKDFGKGEIISIGGMYRNRYALVRE